MKARMHGALALVLAVAPIVSASCGSDGGTKRGGIKQVVLMTHDSFAVSKDVLRAFTAESGFTIKVLKSGDAGATVSQAILTKDHPVADALFGVDNTFLSRALDAELFVSYEAAGLDAVPESFRAPAGGLATPIDYADVCIDYDAAWFGHDGRPGPPRSLADLTDARYKDLTVVENPSTSSPGLAFVLATIAAIGEEGWRDYWARLRANGVRVVSGWEEAYYTDFTAGGGNGDRPIVVSYATDPAADVAFSEGKKTRPSVAVLEASCYRQIEFAGVLDHARNPQGAEALLDFMLSRRFQEDMPLQMFVFPVVSGAGVPDVFEKWAARPTRPLSMDPARIGAQRDSWIDQWTEVVLR